MESIGEKKVGAIYVERLSVRGRERVKKMRGQKSK